MNNYHIYEDIAKGKYSIIYKARKKKTIDYFAVKSMEKCKRKKLMNEVKIFNLLDHVNILKFYNWNETKNHLWAIFEYSSGGNLLSLIEQDKKLTEPQIKIFAKDLIQGLLYLHSKGIIYCDLKPSNILLNEYGTLKYCDFGLARQIVDLIQTDEDVKEGSKKGTPYYMAPELFQDDGVYSYQSDLWSLGCILYELSFGKPPFLSKSFQDLVWLIINKEPEAVEGLSSDFHSFVLGLLQKNPLKRLSWSEIINHPFLNWNTIQLKNLRKIELPQQPHFDRWSQNKYGFQQGLQKNNSNNLISHFKGQNNAAQGQLVGNGMEGVNVLRLSLNVQKNLKREQKQEDTYQNGLFNSTNNNSTSNNNNANNYLKQTNSNASNKQIFRDQDAENKNEEDFCLLNRDQIIDIGYNEREDGSQEEEFSGINTVNLILGNTTIDQQSKIIPSYKEDQENFNNYNNTINNKKNGELESTFKSLYSNNNSNLGINTNYLNCNQLPQVQPLSTGKSQNTSQIAQQTQKFSLSTRSRINQQEVSTGRQGAQTPTSPNNVNRTPNSKNQTARNNSNGTSNHHLQNLTTIMKQNLIKTPSTPHNHSTGSNQGTTHAKSVSPYSNHGSLYQVSNNMNNNISLISNFNNSSLLNTPATPMSNVNQNSSNLNANTPNGFNGVLKNFNIPTSNSSNYSSVLAQGISNSSNNTSMIQPNQMHHHHQHQNSCGNSNNTSYNTGVSPNRKNSTQNNISTCSNYLEAKNAEPSGIFLSKKPSFVIESLEKLFYHQTDTQVKPIIGHKDIEKFPQDCTYKKETLPFKWYSAQDVESGIDRQEINQLFEQIFNALHQPNTDKYNILCYFESIIMNSSVSNRYINSAFVNFLLDLLKNVKVSMIRLRVASSIGFLLRYATVIENELSNLNIPNIIIEVLSFEKESKVRRKLLATLGEYLFYAATQVDDDPINSIWKVQPQVLSFIVKTIKNYEEDELVKFYATKTVENIASQSVTVSQYFCNQDTINALAGLYLFTRNENLKISVIVSLSQIARLNNSLAEFIILQIQGIPNLKEILVGDNAPTRIQQAVLTLINTQIQAFPQSEFSQTLMRDSSFIEAIVYLLESPHTIIRGKSIIFLLLCIKFNVRCLIDLCSTKYFIQLDKLSRDNFKYVQQCYQHLKMLNESSIPIMIYSIKEEIVRIQKGETTSGNPYYYMQNNFSSRMPQLQGNLQYLNVLLQFTKYQQLKSIMFEQNYLEDFFSLFDLVHQSHNSQLQEAKSVLLNLYEVILSNTSYILDKREFFMNILLPKLMDQLSMNLLYSNATISNSGINKDNSPLINNSNSSSYYDGADWKFNYTKLIHDIVTVFMSEWQKWSQNSQQKTNELFINKFVGSILNGLIGYASLEDQVSLMAFKVLQILVENQPALYISALKQKNLLNLLLQQFNYNASRSTLKLVAKIVQVSSLQEIQSYGITQKAVNLFQHFISKEQDQCYEDMIDIFLNITTKMISLKPIQNIEKPSSYDQFVEPKYEILLEAYNLSFSLLRSLDFTLSDKVGMFIIQIIYIYSKSSRNSIGASSQVLNKNEHIITLLNYISQYQMIGPVIKRNTRILNWIVQLLVTSKDIKESIYSTVEKVLQSSKDLKINQTLREIQFYLKNPI
ncbi:hypothetical protein ABPG72_015359 [Tetrahymena utriculariae]